jgi:hypothetical protein
MKQTEKGFQDHNKDRSLESCDTTFTYISRQFPWRKQTSEIDTRIYQFTGNKTMTDIRLDFLDMTVLNSFLLWIACGDQMTYTLLIFPLA